MLRHFIIGQLAAAVVAASAPGVPPPPVNAPGVVVQAPAPLSPAERSAILAALAGAAAHGLDLPVLRADASDADVTSHILTYAGWQHGRRVSPRAVDRSWRLEPAPYDAAAEFNLARASGAVAVWLNALPPASGAYRRLLVERARYARIQEAGGWAALEAGPTMALDDSGPRVTALRARLAIEGFTAPEPAAADVFDAGLAATLMAFQARHGVDADGRLGPNTLRALNTPVGERLAQIDLNLERERWMPRSLPANRIEVDIGAQELVLYRSGAPVLSMRTVVGKPSTRTPMFASQIERIVLNPPWTVPSSIAANELAPRERANPGYLARNRFHYVDGQLVQSPDPASALGVLKFDFESPYGVYLHDTPTQSAFARSQRLLSHGCVRLQHPRELAVALLGDQGWTAQSLEALLGHGPTRVVRLAHAMPLFVVYRTVVVGGDGLAQFRADPYGWDTRLARALARS